MTLEENLFDIENTLKALNMDFMHTYTDVDKTDSDETILNDQFSSIVSSIDEEFSSATGTSIKSTGVFNYNNGGNSTTTTFDFKAATLHIDKHLQYMKSTQGINGMGGEKRSSTPDTGFASRDTNISLSRRSSQKSAYSPQDSFCSTKDCSVVSGNTPCRTSNFQNMSQGLTVDRPNAHTILNHDAMHGACDGDHSQTAKSRLRSTSFTDYPNSTAKLPTTVIHRSAIRAKYSQSSDDADDISKRRPFYKSRSMRARTLRRLSYNPLIASATSSTSSSTDDEEADEASERSTHGNIVRSECDIRTRSTVSLSRRRRQGWARKLIYLPQRVNTAKTLASEHTEDETRNIRSNIYGSNVSIKSAPHYNNFLMQQTKISGRNNNGASLGSYKQHEHDENLPYDERIYDFGGRSDGTTNFNDLRNNATTCITTTTVSLESYSIFTSGCNSGSSTVAYNAVYPEFDVSRLTGLSPISSHPPLFVQSKASSEFQWPEKIHASSIKQNNLLWLQQKSPQQLQLQQQQQEQFQDFSSYTDQILSAPSSPPTDSDRYQFHSEYLPIRLPPSPAP